MVDVGIGMDWMISLGSQDSLGLLKDILRILGLGSNFGLLGSNGGAQRLMDGDGDGWGYGSR